MSPLTTAFRAWGDVPHGIFATSAGSGLCVRAGSFDFKDPNLETSSDGCSFLQAAFFPIPLQRGKLMPLAR